MIQNWSQLLSFVCQSIGRYSSLNVSIHALTDLKVSTMLRNWNCEPSLRPVYQLQMSQSKYLKHCSKLMTSLACHHPHWHGLFNSNLCISASMNQPFQKRTHRELVITMNFLSQSQRTLLCHSISHFQQFYYIAIQERHLNPFLCLCYIKLLEEGIVSEQLHTWTWNSIKAIWLCSKRTKR